MLTCNKMLMEKKNMLMN